MPSYNSTARVPFAKGGSVKDKIKKVFKKVVLGPGGTSTLSKLRDKKYKGKVHSTAEGRHAATKRTIKRGAKKVFDKSGLNLKKGFEGYKRLGSKIAKKFRDKKKIEHN